MKPINKLFGDIVYSSRWLLYPINMGLIFALVIYVLRFLADDYRFLTHSFTLELEPVMVMLLGLVDSFMVANLLTMIIQGSYQIFISKLQVQDIAERPQWLDHIDSGILKIKLALSIAGITLIQILKDFVNIEQVNWQIEIHRIEIHVVCLFSALIMAIIWRLTHFEEPAHVPNH
jgi:uncharacterized protein (TIGR00645 family)